MADHYQVIIVGGGPVGLALAVELGQRDISTVLLERHDKPVRIPKGQNLTQRTLEHFYFWNCVEELRAARVMPQGYPIGGVTAYGNLMSEYWFAPDAAFGRSADRSFYFQINDRLPQYCTEEVLRERLTKLPSVKTLFARRAQGFSANDNGVKVSVQDDVWPYDEYDIEGDYLVGCDGNRSMIREKLGIDRGGSDFDQRMCLAVLRSRQLHEGLKRFGERTTFRAMKPELRGYWQFFGRVDVGEGFFFHAPVPNDATPDTFDFHGLVEDAAGFKFDAEFDHVGFWDLKVSVADEYSKGRVFIAGDAAHAHPPYGGYGLNSGLEDVANLGWKIAAAVQGWGGEALLRSYHDERRPVFLETGEAVIAGGILREREWLARYSPEKDKKEFEDAWHTMATERGQQEYNFHYAGSPVVDGPAGATSGIRGKLTKAAQAGFHLAPVELSNGRNVYEEFGLGYTLVALGADDASVSAFEAAAKAQNVPLKVVRDSYDGGREQFEARMIIVRPDQYLAWKGDAAPADTKALVKKIAGQP